MPAWSEPASPPKRTLEAMCMPPPCIIALRNSASTSSGLVLMLPAGGIQSVGLTGMIPHRGMARATLGRC